MKRLIVLALVLVMAGSVSAAVYEMDISTVGGWLDGDGNPLPVIPPIGWDFDGFGINDGYVEVKAFQDLGGGEWGNVLEIGATDSGNGVMDLDLSSYGIDIQDKVVTYSVRYKLMGALPNDAGPRIGVGFANGNNSNAMIHYFGKQWGDYNSEIAAFNNNDDVYWRGPDDGWHIWVNNDPVLDAQGVLGTWNTATIEVDGPAGTITWTVNGVSTVADEFRTTFGAGVLVNLADSALYPRAGLRLTANGIMQISALRVESIPEPATIALLGMGALALIRKRR